MSAAASVDEADIVQFERLGAAWWDESGPMRPLHEINPLRMTYIRDSITAHFPPRPDEEDNDRHALFTGLSILDIGCGGGLLCEPLTRLGGVVTGIDPAPGNIGVARAHAAEAGLTIDYRATSAEALASDGAQFDVVLAMEVVEHVRNMPEFVKTACSLVRPGGLLMISTLNRTLKSFAFAIIAAEYIAGWLPRGTHHWEKFVTPEELGSAISAAGMRAIDETGLTYNPLRRVWSLGSDIGVNYFITARH